MNQIVVVTAVGQDRPGIIAALTEAVYEVGGNLDDATMTRLHGAFATMVSVRLPNARTLDEVQASLAPVAERMGLCVTVQTVPDEHADTAPDMLLTVYGADRPGIVHAVASRLAGRGVNITDMDTRLIGTAEAPLYVMQLEAVTGDRDITGDLAALRAELGVDITAQPLDSEAL